MADSSVQSSGVAERYANALFELASDQKSVDAVEKDLNQFSALLAESPDLLIADEPTTALDATVQAEVLDLLAALRRDTGLSLLFVSHDLAVVAGICDRIVVMRHGVIVEEGATAEVLAAPRHPYSRALLAAHREYGLDRLRTPLDDREVAHV